MGAARAISNECARNSLSPRAMTVYYSPVIFGGFNMNDVNRAGLVARVKAILMTPKTEWDVIEAEPATVGGLYRNYILILAALPVIAGLIGTVVFGVNLMGVTYRTPVSEAIPAAVLQYVGAVAGIYILALIIDFLAPNFGGTPNRIQALKVAAYSATASWLAGISAIFPPLAFIGILGLYSLYLFYLGLPRLMKVPQEKAMSYTVIVIVAAVVMTFVVGSVVAALT